MKYFRNILAPEIFSKSFPRVPPQKKILKRFRKSFFAPKTFRFQIKLVRKKLESFFFLPIMNGSFLSDAYVDKCVFSTLVHGEMFQKYFEKIFHERFRKDFIVFQDLMRLQVNKSNVRKRNVNWHEFDV